MSKEIFTPGANQTFGYLPGIGQDAANKTAYYRFGAEGAGGGGGGYFGGVAYQENGNKTSVAGSGGSSYISGFPGCKIHPNATFERPVLLGGYDLMNLPNGSFSIGNPGHGHLRITLLIPPDTFCRCLYTPQVNKLLILVLILLDDK